MSNKHPQCFYPFISQVFGSNIILHPHEFWLDTSNQIKFQSEFLEFKIIKIVCKQKWNCMQTMQKFKTIKINFLGNLINLWNGMEYNI